MHPGRLGTDAVEAVIGDEEDLVQGHSQDLGGLGVGRDMGLEGAGDRRRDDGVERDAVIPLRVLQHVGVPVREDHDLEGGLKPGQGVGDVGKWAERLDLSHEVPHLLHRVRDPGTLQDPGHRPVADHPVRGVGLVQQGVDHRVLEMRPTPPGHE